ADQMQSSTPFAPTRAVIAQDRLATAWASNRLRSAAGNFDLNDNSTGAVAGQQPFGGGRASGTNDSADSGGNLALAFPAEHQGGVRPAHQLPLRAHGLSTAFHRSRQDSHHATAGRAAPVSRHQHHRTRGH